MLSLVTLVFYFYLIYQRVARVERQPFEHFRFVLAAVGAVGMRMFLIYVPAMLISWFLVVATWSIDPLWAIFAPDLITIPTSLSIFRFFSKLFIDPLKRVSDDPPIPASSS